MQAPVESRDCESPIVSQARLQSQICVMIIFKASLGFQKSHLHVHVVTTLIPISSWLTSKVHICTDEF